MQKLDEIYWSNLESHKQNLLIKGFLGVFIPIVFIVSTPKLELNFQKSVFLCIGFAYFLASAYRAYEYTGEINKYIAANVEGKREKLINLIKIELLAEGYSESELVNLGKKLENINIYAYNIDFVKKLILQELKLLRSSDNSIAINRVFDRLTS